MQPLRYKRRCGHWSDATLIQPGDGDTIKVYCTGCIIEILEKNYGLRPLDILTAEDFARKYLG